MSETTLTRPTDTSVDNPLASPAQDSRRAVKPKGSANPQYPLSWMRAAAAFSVLTFHAYQRSRSGPDSVWPWEGTVGHTLLHGTELFVDMFFVLSGLVLWLPIARAAVEDRAQRPGKVLLLRRMARLLPLYYAVVLLVWALTNPSLPGHWQDLLLHLTFTQIYSNEYIFWTDGPAWSLAVEFHVYVLLALSVPLVARAVRGRERKGRIAAVSVVPALFIAVGLAFVALITFGMHVGENNYAIWFSVPSRLADFGFGMVLAVIAASGVRLGRAARGVLALIGVGALVGLVWTQPAVPMMAWWHPAYALAITIGLGAIALHDGPWPAWMSAKSVVWVGGLGYGIYLIHEPAMRVLGGFGLLPDPAPGSSFLITALLTSIVATAGAWVSAKTVEAAGLRLLKAMERDGSPRDYYPHIVDQQERREAQPAV